MRQPGSLGGVAILKCWLCCVEVLRFAICDSDVYSLSTAVDPVLAQAHRKEYPLSIKEITLRSRLPSLKPLSLSLHPHHKRTAPISMMLLPGYSFALPGRAH